MADRTTPKPPDLVAEARRIAELAAAAAGGPARPGHPAAGGRAAMSA
jgi:hypothetical protein